jgi:hypothetical protein
MAKLIHEVWQAPDDPGPTVCLAGPHGDGCRATLSPNAKLLWTFEAGSHFEAMTIYYERMGWGTYTTDQEWDMRPYPDEWANI